MADVKKIVVSTPLGDLEGDLFQGLAGGTIYSFLGVPYAKPPVGERRFSNPEALERWSGIREAKKSPPVAPSLNRLVRTPVLFRNCSEDCLYLNIYIPVLPKPGLKLPVLVYFHGGGFCYGTSNREFTDPDFLVDRGIIFVGVNFRMGAFGFLSLQTTECSGNYGLKDQLMALRWTQENIFAFGGDPNNVTIFGFSSGAMCVHFHLISPLSRGLFHRAIAHSSTALSRWALSKYSLESAHLLAKRLGCKSKDPCEILQHLRNVSFEDILMNSRDILEEIEGSWAVDSFVNRGFAPTIEPIGAPDAFITISPYEAVAKGLYADVPVILGCTSHEAIIWLKHKDFVPGFKKTADFQIMLPKEVARPLGSDAMLRASKMVRDFYFHEGVNQSKYIEALTALYTTYPVFKTAEAHVKNPSKKAPYYLYSFTATRENPTVKITFNLTSVPGACHLEEADYLFNGILGRQKANPIKFDTGEHKVQLLLLKLWTDFVKYGVPSADWPSATLENNLSYANLNENLIVEEKFGGRHIQFWDDIYDTLREDKLNSKL